MASEPSAAHNVTMPKSGSDLVASAAPTGAGIVVGFGVLEDIADVVSLLREASARMAEKGTPAWELSTLDSAFLRPFVSRSELIVAKVEGRVVGACTLSRSDALFWPDAAAGTGAYLHKLAVGRAYFGRGVSLKLIERCAGLAREWGCSKLRLDCHPNLSGLYVRLGFAHRDTYDLRGDGSYIAERFEMDLG